MVADELSFEKFTHSQHGVNVPCLVLVLVWSMIVLSKNLFGLVFFKMKSDYLILAVYLGNIDRTIPEIIRHTGSHSIVTSCSTGKYQNVWSLLTLVVL